VFVVCCSVLQRVAACGLIERLDRMPGLFVKEHYKNGAVAVCAAVCCSVLQCVAVCCSVSQCVAVCCNMLQSRGQTCSLCTTFNSNREKKATQQKLARSKNKLCAGDSRRMEGKTTSLTHIFAGGKREGEVSKKNKTCCAAGDSR